MLSGLIEMLCLILGCLVGSWVIEDYDSVDINFRE